MSVESTRTAIRAGVVLVAVLLAALLVPAFRDSGTVLASLDNDLKPELMGANGAEGRLRPDEYVQLKLLVSEQRQLQQVRFAAILLALLCVCAGVGLLLSFADASWAAMTVERTTTRKLPDDAQAHLGVGRMEQTETSPTLGPPVVGLLLVVIGALVVLFAPRGSAPREERARASAVPHAAGDAGVTPH